MVCVSTLMPEVGFAVQTLQTRTYALSLLELLENADADFTLARHELSGNSSLVDRAMLAAMASHILAKIRGDLQPTIADLEFDAAVQEKEPEFLRHSQDSRLAHYSSICQRSLQEHKGSLMTVAPVGAEVQNLSEEQVIIFQRQIALHGWSKLLLPLWFCGNDARMVPDRAEPLMDFGKKDCPFFDNMLLGVQLHRLLEPTSLNGQHQLSIVKETTGALRALIEAHLGAARATCPIELACLRIVCDTVDRLSICGYLTKVIARKRRSLEAGLSSRCADPGRRQQANSHGPNSWIAFADANFMKDKSQEIPEPYLCGVLSALFPGLLPTVETERLAEQSNAQQHYAPQRFPALPQQQQQWASFVASVVGEVKTDTPLDYNANQNHGDYTYDVSCAPIMRQVRGNTTKEVREISAVFDAIHSAYAAAITRREIAPHTAPATAGSKSERTLRPRPVSDNGRSIG